MNETQKQELLVQAKEHVKKVRESISTKLNDTRALVESLPTKIKNADSSHRDLYVSMLGQQKEVLIGLESIQSSPYFVKCTVQFKGKIHETTFYFGKFNHQPENIFSWVAPASVMRFENIGDFSYKSPNGSLIEAKMIRKDQFMIVDGKIVYMTHESNESERQFIHQEYMPSHKSGFVLPEIVEQMEKSQDQVIRSSYKGSYLISGPAGSGKTTLALHRVAYLIQSPETQDLFKGNNIIVFVQDASSKAYFSSLLPSLGIKDVSITTFEEWALGILNISEFTSIRRFGENELERDYFEYYKNQLLIDLEYDQITKSKDPISTLKKLYKVKLPNNLLENFEKQLKEKVLDRYDLTLLLKIAYKDQRRLYREKTIIGNRKINGIYQRIKRKETIEYSLIIMDEVQNYLPDQINIIKNLINKKTESVLYVGDLAQQTQLSTIQEWEEINEDFKGDRKVILNKVYRNTKQIVQYIYNTGLQIDIPNDLRMGEEVVEIQLTEENELTYISEITSIKEKGIIGLITKTPEYKLKLIKQFGDLSNTQIMTINEAQGVEFDTVILCGVNKNDFLISDEEKLPKKLCNEKNRINKDLIYVALTRAISELHVIGQTNLKDIISELNNNI